MQHMVSWWGAVAVTKPYNAWVRFHKKRTPLVDVAAGVLLMDKRIPCGKNTQNGEMDKGNDTFGSQACKPQILPKGVQDKCLNTKFSLVNLGFVAANCWLFWSSLLEIESLALLIACAILLHDTAHCVYEETPCVQSFLK